MKSFMERFRGRDDAFGVFNPKNFSAYTAKRTLTENEYNEHLEGTMGLGVPMVMSDNKCWFGAVDIDAHGEGDSIDIVELAIKIERKKLPLVPCNTRRNGVHLYLFGSKPIPAKDMQLVLKKWAAELGYGGSEIFPKQVTQSMVAGNWINLPYFDCTNTNRYAFVRGKKLSLQEFLEYAESMEQSPSQIAGIIGKKDQKPNMPPCLEILMEEGINEGGRNEAMFSFGVFFKRAFPENWQDKMFELNYSKFDPPLTKSEMDTLIKQSAKEYNYKCEVDPLVSHCDKTQCINRKYGIKSGSGIGTDFELGEVKKILTDPPRWIVTCNDIDVEVSTKEAMNWDMMREAILEKVNIVAPPMKREEWLIMFNERVKSRTEIEAPDDASISGQISSKVEEFVERAVTTEDGKFITGRKEDLTRGMPVLLYGEESLEMSQGGSKTVVLRNVNIDHVGSPFVFFRGPDFVEFLKRRKAEEVKGQMLWSVMRTAGCRHHKLRIGKRVLTVWYTEAKEPAVDVYENVMKDLKEEF